MSRTPKAAKRTVASLRKEESQLQQRLDQVRETIERLGQVTGASPTQRAKAPRSSRRLSAKGREAISRAAKRRWAAYRKEQRKEQRQAR